MSTFDPKRTSVPPSHCRLLVFQAPCRQRRDHQQRQTERSTGRPNRQTRTGTQPQRGPAAYQYGFPQPGPQPQPGPTPQANAGAKPTAKAGPHPPPRQPPHPPRQPPPPCQPPPCQPPAQRASALPGAKAKRLATSAILAKDFTSFDIAAPLKLAVGYSPPIAANAPSYKRTSRPGPTADNWT